MLVISDNLAGLVSSRALCPPALVEEFSLGIRLDEQVRRMRSDVANGRITYGLPYDADSFFAAEEQVERDLLLRPGERVLACSADRYLMPPNYFGLVQTKGSLARLFVSATCNDGQIEPGYEGKITLELSNDATFEVSIPLGVVIAQLFVFRCTTSAAHPYDGRYQGATGPTIALFSRS